MVKKIIKTVFPWSPSAYNKLKCLGRSFYNVIQPPIVVLLYHRCAHLDSDPQLMGISPQNFAEQIRWITDNYPVLRFDDEWNNVKEPSVIITFDDGYEDNYLNAVPILEEFECPATIFVTTGLIDTENELWNDEVERIVLLNTGLIGKKLQYEFRGEMVEKRINTNEDLRALYDEIHQIVRIIKDDERSRFLKSLSDRWGSIPLRRTHRFMNRQQLKTLGNSKYVNIGAHTVTHTRLSSLTYEEQMWEILESKKVLETILEKKVTTFSVPFGTKADYNQDTIGIVKKLGFARSASNFPGQIHKCTSRYELPRQLVRNWELKEFQTKFQDFWTN